MAATSPATLTWTSGFNSATCTWDEIQTSIQNFSFYIESWLKTRLQAHDESAQCRILLVGENSIEYFVALMGIRAAGHVAVPVSRNIPDAKLENIAKELNAALLLADPPRKLSTDLPQIHLSPETFDQLPLSSARTARKLDPKRLALVIHTSGSTGTQKRAGLSENARRLFVMSQLVQQKSRADSRECTLVSSPLSHVLANNLLESAYALRESAVLLSKFDAKLYIESIEKYKVTKLSLVPSMWALMLKHKDELEKRSLDSVEYIYFSSEPLSQNLINEAKFYFKKATIENCYGISEVGPNLFGPSPTGQRRPERSVGFPRRGFQYRLVNGALEIKSPFMMNAYLEQPAMTSAALTEDRFFRTKDLFEIDENGFYFHRGRADDMIISGGTNIYPAEIESLLNLHPGVAESAVIKLEDSLKHEAPYAFVVLKAGFALNEAELVMHLSTYSARYLIPKRIWIIENLPINESFKIDRVELKRRALLNL